MDTRIISREAIQKNAIELFNEKGVSLTSINELVKKCGIAKGTFYLYFKDKDELVDSVYDKYRDRFIQEVIVKNQSIHKVALFSNSLIEYFTENRMFLIELRRNITEYKKYPYIEKTVDAFYSVIISYLKFYGENNILNIDIYVHALIVMILEICYKAVVEGSEEDLEEAKKILSDIFKRFFGCSS
ncbi:MAG: TetR/AcrR family transcriptional regulator [Bacillota bacterium]